MLYRSVVSLSVFLMAAAPAAGQIHGLVVSRHVYGRAALSTGESTSQILGDGSFGPPFIAHVSASLSSPDGASGRARARQNSWMNPTSAGGYFRSVGGVVSGETSVTSEVRALSFMLFDFNLAETSHVRFGASAEIAYSGLVFGDDPVDRGGYASVLLTDIAGVNRIVDLTLDLDQEVDSLGISMVLPAGLYRLVAHTEINASSAEIIGLPPGTGTGTADLRFSMRIVPAPGAVVAIGLFATLPRRRR